MTLPIINAPEYKLRVPSTDEELTYRPFLVKEEKLLLIAQETGTEDATYRAIKNIIENCCHGKVELDKLPLFDMEYIFLNIRAKSVGEVATLKITCPDDKETTVDIEVDLTKVQVQMDETHDARIQISEKPNIGVLMSYPSIDTLGHSMDSKKKDADRLFEMIASSLYQIWHDEETFDAMDYTLKEKMTFLESLSHQQFEKMQKFFETMPSLKHDIEVTNPKTNVTSTVTLQGMNDFF